MRIESHAHGITADLDSNGRCRPPVRSAWNADEMTVDEYLAGCSREGIEKILLLDPAPVAFELKRIFGDFVMPAPMVDIDDITPVQIDEFFRRGAVGIKFISPSRSYGHESYWPLYDAIHANRGLAVFHSGYLVTRNFEPGGIMGRRKIVDICDMRPAALDRVARKFPELKILMAHFGNPWWEEAWKMVSSHPNIYSDFSGGTAYRRAMDMWKQIFAPDGNLDSQAVGKLCFGTDGQYFEKDHYGNSNVPVFYERFFEELNVPDELRRKVERENILQLTERRGGA